MPCAYNQRWARGNREPTHLLSWLDLAGRIGIVLSDTHKRLTLEVLNRDAPGGVGV